ncbi:hypothetical protein Cch01nite_38690 [Cellulomonas chitinilytica]|uniref:Activator of Hsp90 ATPase homologue 1/2-like C-terminal domain-containing protein n=1 Tax=Cellulomonas chitinilytica TaxID=398759 RepID=A0A919P6G8_9CELL|nr:SRPBCC family protein [Cellulomonas chitinilytica]GIG23145.1 hypothetical protein Cch01nite_38690 [Cellulomonas chitinilytica]
MTTDPHGTLATDAEGTTVRFERWYPTSVDDLWSALTERDRVGRWLGALHGDLRTGGRFELRMGDDLPGADQNATGEVVACDPPHGFAVSWAFPGEAETCVRATLRPDGDGVVLVLVHSGLTLSAARGYGGGWHASLDLLDDAVAGRPARSWQEAFEAALPAYREA